jgi:hypothetical protein
MQNKVLCTIGNIPRCTPVCDLDTAFNFPYMYDYITKLCKQQAEGKKKVKISLLQAMERPIGL